MPDTEPQIRSVLEALSTRMLIGDHRAMRDVDPVLLSTDVADRAGRCYELTLAWMWAHRGSPQIAAVTLCHGSIEGPATPRIAHAWLTLPMPHRRTGKPVLHAHCLTSLITVPETVWTRKAKAIALRRYNILEAMDQVALKDTSGPWHSRPFGWDDCPHGLEPNGCTKDTDGDGNCGGRCPSCNPMFADRLCPHGCTPDTLHSTAGADGTIV